MYSNDIVWTQEQISPKKRLSLPKTYQEEMNEIIDNMIKLLKQDKEMINKAEKKSIYRRVSPKT